MGAGSEPEASRKREKAVTEVPDAAVIRKKAAHCRP
jgi:hypothetical protein